MMNNAKQKKKLTRIIIYLSSIVIFMFFFSFALIPLYNVLCKTLGINGKTNISSMGNKSWVDKSRTITVQFLATNNESLPWAFRPLTKKVNLHPGEDTLISYYAKNNSNKRMTVQAIPSVTPGLAASHLKKTECFCFNQQTLKAHQSMQMPLLFHIDNDLPKNIHEITLSYTLFVSKKPVKNKVKGRL